MCHVKPKLLLRHQRITLDSDHPLGLDYTMVIWTLDFIINPAAHPSCGYPL